MILKKLLGIKQIKRFAKYKQKIKIKMKMSLHIICNKIILLINYIYKIQNVEKCR